MTRGARWKWALGGVLALCTVAYGVGIDWGLPARGATTWAHDELTPLDRGRTAMDRHHGRYPPLHYRILDGVYGAADLLPGENRAERRQLAARYVSLVMTLATLGLIGVCFRQLSDWTPGAPLAAALYGLSPVVAYYAKVANLEAPYVMWFAASLVFYLRILRHHRLADYLLCTLFATLAGITKDQAFTLYLLPALVVLWSLGEHLGNRARALVDRRVGLSLGLFALIFGVAHRLWRPDGFLDHVRVLLGPGSDPYASYPASIQGYLSMLPAALWNLAFVAGVPALVLSLFACLRRFNDRRRIWWPLLAVPLSLLLFFLVPIRFQYARFFLPVALVVALLAARGVELLAASRPRTAGAVAAAALLLLAGRSAALDYRMLKDTRYQAEEWIDEHPGTVVLGRHRVLLPRVGSRRSWEGLDSTGPRWLQARGIESLVIVPYEIRRGLPQQVLTALRDGSWSFGLAREFPSSSPALVWPGVESNLKTVDPEVLAMRKIVPWPHTPAEIQSMVAALQADSEDWDTVTREVWNAYRPRARHDLSPSVKAFPVYRDRWTIGDRAALVVFPCSTSPVVQLHRPAAAPPTAVEILEPQARRELTLQPGEWRPLTRTSAACESLFAVRVRALTPWQPEAESRPLGVALAVARERSAAGGGAVVKTR